MHHYIQHLLHCIDLEENEQANRYKLDQTNSLKKLKAEGLILHPITVTRKNFGYADYPEISFKLSFPCEVNMFRDGAAIECFLIGEESVKGTLLNLEGKNGEFRLFAPDYPDWIEDKGVGIKLCPDTHTSSIMKKVLLELENNRPSFNLFLQLHSNNEPTKSQELHNTNNIQNINKQLNESQQQAICNIINNDCINILHGPPGTGKTSTLVEAIVLLVQKGEKVLLSAPSKTAVDHISKLLLQKGVQLLRVGNTSKVEDTLYNHTIEGKLNSSKTSKEIKELRKRADEFRRMALKYKRNFGKAEREQRNLLFKEVKSIRSEIRKLQNYNETKLVEEAQVIAGTPIGLYDANLKSRLFTTLVIDEAGQCMEPLAWCIIPLAEKIVLAGDHWQLPPTVISNRAAQLGFNKSILEIAINKIQSVSFLNIQYRMRKAIAGFSSLYFYDNLLYTAEHLNNKSVHLTFIDTAGSGLNESYGSNGLSLQNDGEISVIQKLIEQEQLSEINTAIISPYSGQVIAAKEVLNNRIRISTIDSFQGQEKETVIVSLVRSNDEGQIGFLNDYRRMNVAITRAKEQLYVIGDSSTIGADSFYNQFLTYVEKNGTYRTIWEFDLP